jgi:hypothetical protein
MEFRAALLWAASLTFLNIIIWLFAVFLSNSVHSKLWCSWRWIGFAVQWVPIFPFCSASSLPTAPQSEPTKFSNALMPNGRSFSYVVNAVSSNTTVNANHSKTRTVDIQQWIGATRWVAPSSDLRGCTSSTTLAFAFLTSIFATILRYIILQWLQSYCLCVFSSYFRSWLCFC